MKHIFIINPSAGKGNRVDKLMADIQRIGKERDLDYTLYTTKEPGDSEHYTRQAIAEAPVGEPLRIYACGGDGTINECVNGAVGAENVEMAVIPIGTGNDFVRNFGGSRAFTLPALLAGHTEPLDLIKYNERYCMNMINIGYDCAVVVRTDKIKKKPWIPSSMAYIVGLVGELVKKTGVSFRCRVDDGEEMEKKLLLSLFANGSYCGGGFYSAPAAELQDGMMDFCFIRYLSRLRFLSLVGRYKKGTHLAIKDPERFFEYQKCRKVTLTFDGPQYICVDGEIEQCERLELSMVPRAIRMVIPGEAKA